MLWIVLSVFEVQSGAFGVSGAARSAGRVYALAPNDAVGQARAERPCDWRWTTRDWRDGPSPLRVTCTPFSADCHSGTSVITVQVFTRVEIPLLPEVLGGDAPSVRSRCDPLGADRAVPGGRPCLAVTGGRDERGQATVLIIGLATFLAMTVALVVDATAAYLQRQGLDTLADGAALRGADLGATGKDVYEGGVPADRLELTAAQVRQAVDVYLRDAGAYTRYPGLSYRVRVDPTTQSVEVSLSAPLELPLTVPGLARAGPGRRHRVGRRGSRRLSTDQTPQLPGKHDSPLVRRDDGLHPVAQPELGEDPAHVGLDGATR